MPPVEKEAYFTSDTLANQALELFQAAAVPSRRGAPPFDPQQAALLLLDLQRYFLDPASHAFVPSAAAILPNLERLVQAFSNRNLPVIFTRHVNTPEDAGSMKTWWRDLLQPENPLSALAPGLPAATAS